MPLYGPSVTAATSLRLMGLLEGRPPYCHILVVRFSTSNIPYFSLAFPPHMKASVGVHGSQLKTTKGK